MLSGGIYDCDGVYVVEVFFQCCVGVIKKVLCGSYV